MTQKPLTIIVIISAFLLLGIFFFWWPKYQSFSDKLDELRVKREELRTKEEYFVQLQKLSSSFQEYSLEVSKVEAALPLTPQVPDFLNFVERQSARSGLILQSTSVAKAQVLQQGSDIFKIPVSVSLAGPYPAFKNFLLALQSSSRLAELVEVSFFTPQQGQIFTFDLKMRIHSY